ncbi:MAG: ABC transporter permease [Rudaea sp.]
MRILRALFRPLIRASAFMRAEVFEILRQPRLILTLVLGPFLILLLFGIGFRNSARPLRTTFVVDNGDPLSQEIEQMAPSLGPQLVFKGVTSDKQAALDELKAGQVDLVAVAPPGAMDSVKNNQQATFTLYHNEIDPVQVNYIKYFGQTYMDEVNRRVLSTVIKESTAGVPTKVDPAVMVSPFVAKTESIAPVQPTIMGFYAPAVIVLLLQHLAITFGALSIVREARLGTLELFRVSPLNAGEALIGKYISYLVFAAILGAVLTLLVLYGLGVPLLGDPRYYALTVAALIFAALGYGFVVSLISQTDSQAVQYSMLLLLATVFFSGFFMRLDQLWEPIRVVSYALPGTYGILLLQNIMLRGTFTGPYTPLEALSNPLASDAGMLYALAGMGVVLFFVALLLLRRRMARG